jgi:hypothetical protein
MDRFKLPLLDAAVPLSSAFSTLMERNISGVVVRAGSEYRLLHLDDLRRALKAKVHTTGAVGSFTPLHLSDLRDDAGLKTELEMTGYRYLFLGEQGDDALLLSGHEPLALPFVSPPTIVRCTDPYNTHLYPPHRRTAGQTTCTFDNSPLV